MEKIIFWYPILFTIGGTTLYYTYEYIRRRAFEIKNGKKPYYFGFLGALVFGGWTLFIFSLLLEFHVI